MPPDKNIKILFYILAEGGKFRFYTVLAYLFSLFFSFARIPNPPAPPSFTYVVLAGPPPHLRNRRWGKLHERVLGSRYTGFKVF